jgi:hypothetical protein
MANGTLAASQLEMLSQSGTGIMTIVPPATNTNQTLTLPDVTGTVATVGNSLTRATAVTASGTSVDFTGIPSWAKRITVMINGVSTNGTSNPLIQIGDSGGIEATGYAGTSHAIGTGVAGILLSTGFSFGANNWAAAALAHGAFVIQNISGNNWTCSGFICNSVSVGTFFCGGSKTLSDTLDRVRITTANGTDTFDAGTINILYEG